MDSGATKHMTPHRAAFDTFEVIPSRNVHSGDDSVVDVIEVDSIAVQVLVRGRSKKIRIKDVLHVPKLHANLLSVSKLVSSGMKMQFNVDGCTLRAPNEDVLSVAPREDNLYQVTFTNVHGVNVANLAQPSTKNGALELWHRRLGHLNVRSVRFLQSMVSGIALGKDESSMSLCKGCVQGRVTNPDVLRGLSARKTSPRQERPDVRPDATSSGHMIFTCHRNKKLR